MTKLYTLPQWILFFYIYCFLGWVWESTYVSVRQGHPVNRGFLKGPFLPIYGSGAVCILAVTIPVRDSVLLMFLVGMFSASLLEYVTGAVMEKLFRVRYWDYSGKFLNLNGHICLSSTLCWGVMTILMVKVIQVRIEPPVLQLGRRAVGMLVMVITPVVTADFVTSFIAAMRLRDALIMNDRIRAELERMNARKTALEQQLEKMRGKVFTLAYLQGAGDRLQEASLKAYQQLREELQEIYMRTGAYKEKLKLGYTSSIRGLLRRNPTAVSRIHRESFAELKKNILEKLEEIRR